MPVCFEYLPRKSVTYEFVWLPLHQDLHKAFSPPSVSVLVTVQTTGVPCRTHNGIAVCFHKSGRYSGCWEPFVRYWPRLGDRLPSRAIKDFADIVLFFTARRRAGVVNPDTGRLAGLSS